MVVKFKTPVCMHRPYIVLYTKLIDMVMYQILFVKNDCKSYGDRGGGGQVQKSMFGLFERSS